MFEPAFKIPEEVLEKNPSLRRDYESELVDTDEQEALKPSKPDKEIEKDEIAVLLGEGAEFYCPTIIRRVFGIKQDKWRIKAMSTATMVRLCREYLEISVDPSKLKTQSDIENVIDIKNMIVEHGERMARIVAISVVGSIPLIGWLLRKFFTKYFYARMTPDALLRHAVKVNNYNSYANFYHSIELTQGKRLTQPTSIEEKDSKKG